MIKRDGWLEYKNDSYPNLESWFIFLKKRKPQQYQRINAEDWSKIIVRRNKKRDNNVTLEDLKIQYLHGQSPLSLSNSDVGSISSLSKSNSELSNPSDILLHKKESIKKKSPRRVERRDKLEAPSIIEDATQLPEPILSGSPDYQDFTEHFDRESDVQNQITRNESGSSNKNNKKRKVGEDSEMDDQFDEKKSKIDSQTQSFGFDPKMGVPDSLRSSGFDRTSTNNNPTDPNQLKTQSSGPKITNWQIPITPSLSLPLDKSDSNNNIKKSISINSSSSHDTSITQLPEDYQENNNNNTTNNNNGDHSFEHIEISKEKEILEEANKFLEWSKNRKNKNKNASQNEKQEEEGEEQMEEEQETQMETTERENTPNKRKHITDEENKVSDKNQLRDVDVNQYLRERKKLKTPNKKQQQEIISKKQQQEIKQKQNNVSSQKKTVVSSSPPPSKIPSQRETEIQHFDDNSFPDPMPPSYEEDLHVEEEEKNVPQKKSFGVNSSLKNNSQSSQIIPTEIVPPSNTPTRSSSSNQETQMTQNRNSSNSSSVQQEKQKNTPPQKNISPPHSKIENNNNKNKNHSPPQNNINPNTQPQRNKNSSPPQQIQIVPPSSSKSENKNKEMNNNNNKITNNNISHENIFPQTNRNLFDTFNQSSEPVTRQKQPQIQVEKEKEEVFVNPSNKSVSTPPKKISTENSVNTTPEKLQEKIILCSGLKSEELKLAKLVCIKLGGRLVKSWSEDVTHLVTNVDPETKTTKRTVKYLLNVNLFFIFSILFFNF